MSSLWNRDAAPTVRAIGWAIMAVLGSSAGVLRKVANWTGSGEWLYALAVACMMFALAGITILLLGVALSARRSVVRGILVAAAIVPLILAASLLRAC